MKVFYDAEFLDDGRTIDLVSIGMTRDDGEEYYAINGNMPWARILNHEWLNNNVIPHLPTLENGAFLNHQHADVKPHHVIKNEIETYLFEAALVDNDLELWSWYCAYDHVALAQLWGPMISLPAFVPMYSNDIRQEFRRWGNPPHNVPPGNHNALADARYHKRLYEFIQGHAQAHPGPPPWQNSGK